VQWVISKKVEATVRKLSDPASTMLELQIWVNITIAAIFQTKAIYLLDIVHTIYLEVMPDISYC
jgi:hypothetical protein